MFFMCIYDFYSVSWSINKFSGLEQLAKFVIFIPLR